MPLKKLVAALLAAAVPITGPGFLAAAETAGSRAAGVPVVNLGGIGALSGVLPAGVPNLSVSLPASPAAGLDSVGAAIAAPSSEAAVPVAALAPQAAALAAPTKESQAPVSASAAAQAASERLVANEALGAFTQAQGSQDFAARSGAVRRLFDGSSVRASSEDGSVAGRASAAAALSRLSARGDRSKARAGSGLVEVAVIGAGIATVVAFIASPSLRNLAKRMGNVMLGWLGIGVKKAEKPEVLAQKYIDDLKAQMPRLNQAVAEFSAKVEELRQQEADQTKKSAKLDGTIDEATRLGKDEAAKSLILQKKAIDDLLKTTKERRAAAETSLTQVKKERDQFYYDQQRKIEEVKSLLARKKQADLTDELAELKGHFKVGDQSDVFDKIKEGVEEAEAKAKGKLDSADSSAENTVKDIERSVEERQADEELARRKAKLGQASEAGDKAKDKAGSALRGVNLAWTVGVSAAALGLGVFAGLAGGFFGAAAGAVVLAPIALYAGYMAGVLIAKAVGINFLSGGLPGALIGGVVGVVGGAIAGFAAISPVGAVLLGLAGVASAVSFSPYFPGGSNRTPSLRERSNEYLETEIEQYTGVLATLDRRITELEKEGRTQDAAGLRRMRDMGAAQIAMDQAELARRAGQLGQASTAGDKTKDKAGSGLVEVAMIGAGIATVVAFIASPSLRNLAKRMSNVMLGWLGIGVKKAEKPEVLAQKYIDDLKAQMPRLNQAVAEFSAKVEELRQQEADQTKKSAKLDGTIDEATRLGKDEAAKSLILQKKAIDDLLKTTKERRAAAETSLTQVKKERDQFYYDQQRKIEEVKSLLARKKQADLTDELAELKGHFKVGDQSDVFDKIKEGVEEAEAKAKGKLDSADSSAENTVKDIERSVEERQADEELARRKAKLGQASEAGDKAKDKAGSGLLAFAAAAPALAAVGASLHPLLAMAIGVAVGALIGGRLGWKAGANGSSGGLAAGMVFGALGALAGALIGSVAGTLIGTLI